MPLFALNMPRLNDLYRGAVCIYMSRYGLSAHVMIEYTRPGKRLNRPEMCKQLYWRTMVLFREDGAGPTREQIKCLWKDGWRWYIPRFDESLSLVLVS
jgi:hypothetical protein